MKRLKILAIAAIMALSLAACGDKATAPPAQRQSAPSLATESGSAVAEQPQAGVPSTSAEQPQTDKPLADAKGSDWVGTYTGDDVTIEITESGGGKLNAKVHEQMLLESELAVSGNTATGSVTVQPEMQGGDMTLEGAREQFPDCLYEFTLTVDGMSMSYSRVVTLIDMGTQDTPEQTMEFAAELTKVIKSN